MLRCQLLAVMPVYGCAVIWWFHALDFSSEGVRLLLPVQTHRTVFLLIFELETVSTFNSHLKTHLFPISCSY